VYATGRPDEVFTKITPIHDFTASSISKLILDIFY
jgi:hypothetical protein